MQHWITGSILIPLCHASAPGAPVQRVLNRGCLPPVHRAPRPRMPFKVCKFFWWH